MLGNTFENSQILDSINNAENKNYDLYKDGLKITTTLDLAMQDYAEKGMIKHMERLQNQYEKAYGANAPWIKNETLITVKSTNHKVVSLGDDIYLTSESKRFYYLQL